MTSTKTNEGKKKKKQNDRVYIPDQLRSRPFRCIALPAVCLVIFIFYWFILVPLIYHIILTKCKEGHCDFPRYWNYVYWIIVSLIFLVMLAIAMCLWCHFPKDEKPKGVKQKLLQNDSTKQSKVSNNYSVEYEKKSISRETIENDNFNIASLQNLEGKIETPITPTRKSIIKEEIITRETKKVENKQAIENDTKLNFGKTMSEEIDKMFPRCSTRRKGDHRKRPDTLIIHSPKYPRSESDLKRHSIASPERPKSTSPLTPREIFFFDLLASANRQTLDRTVNFIENERKHSSNNFRNMQKPEIKDFILKERSVTSEASSPEIFIANVAKRRSCTNEVFMYVDGGQPEEVLTICHMEQDDDVFQN